MTDNITQNVISTVSANVLSCMYNHTQEICCQYPNAKVYSPHQLNRILNNTGSIENVKVLLKNGANVNLKNVYGDTPIDTLTQIGK